MSQTITLKPKITARDRLVLTVIVAVLLHVIVVFGIVFDTLIKKDHRKSLPALDITLVTPNDTQLPSKADYLAQANQDSLQDKPEEHFSPEDSASRNNAKESSASSQALSDQEASEDPVQGEEVDAVVSNEASMFVQNSSVIKQKNDLISDSLDFIRQQQASENDNTLTHKYINVRSKSDVEAAYWATWQNRIEKVGNINYSDELLLRNISGDVKTDISLNPDGSLYDFKIIHSDHPLLDEEVRKIIQLATPFDPIPEALRGTADIFHIERVWRFGEAEKN